MEQADQLMSDQESKIEKLQNENSNCLHQIDQLKAELN